MERKRKKKQKTGHRIFIALMPDKNTLNRLREVQRLLHKFDYKLKLINLEQIHITLKFLGDNVSEESIDVISKQIRTIIRQAKPFNINISEVSFGFNNKAKPNVVFAITEESEEVASLVKILQKIIKPLALPDVIKRKDRQKFIGHLTIARVKKDISSSFVREVREILSKSDFKPCDFTVNEVFLIESKLTNKGSIYSIYDRFSLSK